MANNKIDDFYVFNWPQLKYSSTKDWSNDWFAQSLSYSPNKPYWTYGIEPPLPKYLNLKLDALNFNCAYCDKPVDKVYWTEDLAANNIIFNARCHQEIWTMTIAIDALQDSSVDIETLILKSVNGKLFKTPFLYAKVQSLLVKLQDSIILNIKPTEEEAAIVKTLTLLALNRREALNLLKDRFNYGSVNTEVRPFLWALIKIIYAVDSSLAYDLTQKHPELFLLAVDRYE